MSTAPRITNINDIARKRQPMQEHLYQLAEPNRVTDHPLTTPNDEIAKRTGYGLRLILSRKYRIKSALADTIVTGFGLLPFEQTSFVLAYTPFGGICRGQKPNAEPETQEEKEQRDYDYSKNRIKELRRLPEKPVCVTPGGYTYNDKGKKIFFDATWDYVALLTEWAAIRALVEEDRRWETEDHWKGALDDAANARYGRPTAKREGHPKPSQPPDRHAVNALGDIRGLILACEKRPNEDPSYYRELLHQTIDALFDTTDPEALKVLQIKAIWKEAREAKAKEAKKPDAVDLIGDEYDNPEGKNYPDSDTENAPHEEEDMGGKNDLSTPNVETDQSQEERKLTGDKEKPGEPIPTAVGSEDVADNEPISEKPSTGFRFSPVHLPSDSGPCGYDMDRDFDNVRAVLDEVKDGPKGSFTALCPAHDDTRRSLKVWRGTTRVRWKCYAGCSGRAIADEINALIPQSQKTPWRQSTWRDPVAIYDYRDSSGALVFQKVRFENKGFGLRRPDGAEGWTWNIEGVRRGLYRLPELLGEPLSKLVLVTESEYSADLLTRHGFLAVAVGGAEWWRKDMVEPFRGRRVCILPDNNEPGVNLSRQIQRALQGVAESVTELVLDGLGDGEAVDNWIEKYGHSPEELRERVSEIV